MYRAFEALISCPVCKQIEFLLICDGEPALYHNYHRTNGEIYHGDCKQPCRLFNLSYDKSPFQLKEGVRS